MKYVAGGMKVEGSDLLELRLAKLHKKSKGGSYKVGVSDPVINGVKWGPYK